MGKPIKLICNGTSDELMVHWPNGVVEFVGFWGLVKLLWWAVRNQHRLIVVDAQTGEEFES